VTVRRPPHALLVVAALGAAACARPRVALTPVFETDAGAGECAAFTDLACVNFINFQIAEKDDLTPSTECITVDKRLNTLCDITQLMHGAEIFRYDKDARVQIKMWGVRIFPATSCEINPDCPPKSLFYGVTDWIKASDVQGGQLPLRIIEATACGQKEVYRPRGGRDCYSVCDNTEAKCVMHDGCVCLIQDDAGTPQSSGAWERVDAGAD
jgi:hypothetical protein